MTDDTIEFYGHTLHQIKALIDIPDRMVRTGDLGGWIESEENLSHEGSCWVDGEAKIYGHANVRDNACVCENACVCDNACVCGYAEVYGNATVFGNAAVCEAACVCGNARVGGDAAEVYGYATVFGNAAVCGNAKVRDNAKVGEMAKVHGNCSVSGDAVVRGNAVVRDGEIHSSHDILVVGPIGSRAAYATFNKVSGTVCTGCFKGTLDEFEKAVKERHGDNEPGKEYAHFIAYIKSVLADTQTK